MFRSLGPLNLFPSFLDLNGKGNEFLMARHSFGNVPLKERWCSSLLLALIMAFRTFVAHLLGNFKLTFRALRGSFETS